MNNQSLIADIGFKADSVLIDPDMYLVSKNNVLIKTKALVPEPALMPLPVSPNPFTKTINFSLPDSGNKKVLIRLFDMYGHLVLTKSIVAITANQKIQY
jgi:hypothetical protein